jgi:hypothetical protein
MGIFDAPDFGPSMDTLNKSGRKIGRATRRGLGDIRSGVDEAQPYLEENAQNWRDIQGQQQGGYDMYQNSLGLNGQAGYDAALGAFQQGPGYQFALDQANQNVLRNSAALGGVASGNTLMGLSDRAQQLQNLEFGNWQNRLAGFDPMRGASGLATGLFGLGSLFENEGKNLAGTRMQGAGLQAQNYQALAQMQQNQALADQQADMMPINLGLGLLGGVSGFYGA